MSFIREEKEGCALLRIEGSMMISEAEAFRNDLVECLELYNGIIIDMAGVSDIDAAAMQLLFSARITANETGKRFEIANASMSSMAVIERAGIDPEVMFKSTHG